MRGPQPKKLEILIEDLEVIQTEINSGKSKWCRVKRALILLHSYEGEQPSVIAKYLSCGRTTVWRICQRYKEQGLKCLDDAERSGRPTEISLLERAQIVQIACLDPKSLDLQLTHWSSRSLTQTIIEQGIVKTIHYSTVHLILENVSLQPHRSCYWKTTKLDEHFLELTQAILYCYSHVNFLVEQGYLVVCADEKPNIQALERTKLLARPGQIERQEFEYTRHDTVNFLVFLIVHTGQMVGYCIEKNDHQHYLEALEDFRKKQKGIKGIYLIQDNGPSHIANGTKLYFKEHQDFFKPKYTPTHASWLNQAEILLKSFSGYYLKRGSWVSRQELIDHLTKSWPEYNQRYAHPFNWTWSQAKMRKWFDKHSVPT